MARFNIEDSAAEEEIHIDLAPMLDMVMILLIFFITSTSFIKESGVEVSRPVAQTTSAKPAAYILIAITEENDVWMQQKKIDIRTVRANVERLRAENPEGGVVIQADKGSDTDTLVRVMDQAKMAGVDDISIASTNK